MSFWHLQKAGLENIEKKQSEASYGEINVCYFVARFDQVAFDFLHSTRRTKNINNNNNNLQQQQLKKTRETNGQIQTFSCTASTRQACCCRLDWWRKRQTLVFPFRVFGRLSL